MKGKILVVDDEAHTVRLVKRILEREGYEVKGAYNGDEALEVMSTFSPDLILLDLMMPGVPPKEVISIMRKNGKKAKIFYFSALKATNDATERLKRNLVSDNDKDYVMGYIEKPFEVADLKERIKAALQ